MYNMKILKYKGKKFLVGESELSISIPGVRVRTADHTNMILINSHLDKRKKELEFHRLLTGRGLRDVKKAFQRAVI